MSRESARIRLISTTGYSVLVPRGGLEPPRFWRPPNFRSNASANFTIRAFLHTYPNLLLFPCAPPHLSLFLQPWFPANLPDLCQEDNNAFKKTAGFTIAA